MAAKKPNTTRARKGKKSIAARAAVKRKPAAARARPKTVPVQTRVTIRGLPGRPVHMKVRGTAVVDAAGEIVKLELEPERRMTLKEQVAEAAKDPRSRTWIQGLIGLAPGDETGEELLAKFKEWNG